MTMIVHDCEQGSEEWFRVRAGMPTASEFSTVMANGKGGAESKTRRTYMLKLAGERITGEPMENTLATNPHIMRGKIMEDEARKFYSFMTDAEPARVGFISNGAKGGSPDALIGTSRMLEIKTALPHILISHLLKDEFPPEHKAQCQGNLWVGERDEIDLVIYWPRVPLFVKTVGRDEAYIREMGQAVDKFNDELNGVVERIKNYVPAKEQKAA